MSEIDALVNGLAQGAGMVAVFAVYLDRRLVGIENALKDLVRLNMPPRGGCGGVASA